MRLALALAALGIASAITAPALAQGAPPVVVAPAAPGAPAPTYVIVQQPAPGQPPPAGYAGQPLPPTYYPQPAYNTAPPVLDWEDGDPIPAGYHKVTRVRKGLVIGGAVLFGTTYLLSVMSAGIGQLINDVPPVGNKDFGPMLIPLAGPFVAMGTTHPSSGGVFALAMLGISQVGGAAMFITGFAAPSSKLVKDAKKPGPSFAVLPTTFGPGSAGIGFVGSM